MSIREEAEKLIEAWDESSEPCLHHPEYKLGARHCSLCLLMPVLKARDEKIAWYEEKHRQRRAQLYEAMAETEKLQKRVDELEKTIVSADAHTEMLMDRIEELEKE